MWRDQWFAVGVVGAVLACLVCLTPIAIVALGVIGFGAWAGYLDIVLGLLLAAFVVLAVYRYRVVRRGMP